MNKNHIGCIINISNNIQKNKEKLKKANKKKIASEEYES